MKSRTLDEDCFVSPVVILVKNDKSIKIALDSRTLNDSCKKIYTTHAEHGVTIEPNLGRNYERPNRELKISKIDVDYAYG